MGFGETNRWYLGSLDKSKTITLVYEMLNGAVNEVIFLLNIGRIQHSVYAGVH